MVNTDVCFSWYNVKTRLGKLSLPSIHNTPFPHYLGQSSMLGSLVFRPYSLRGERINAFSKHLMICSTLTAPKRALCISFIWCCKGGRADGPTHMDIRDCSCYKKYTPLHNFRITGNQMNILN